MKQRLMRIAARLFVLAPFILGFIRIAQKGDDKRVLALAVASFAGAVVAIVANRSHDRTSRAVTRTSIFVSACATIGGLVAGFFIQRSFSVGAAMFAIVFGIFWGIGYALDALSRRSPDSVTGA